MYSTSNFYGGRMSYADAVKRLAKARNKWDRPLDGKRNSRIIWLGDGKAGVDSIALRLHATTCVVIHPDGTYTINTGGWNTNTTRGFINNYSPVSLHSDKCQLKISDKNNSVTPPKVWKCRTCKHQGGEWIINKGEYTFVPDDRPGHWGRHVFVPYDEPISTWSECYRCKGTGRTDYGSNPIYTDWDGAWLRIDADGNVVGAEPDHVANKFYAKAKAWDGPKDKDLYYSTPAGGAYYAGTDTPYVPQVKYDVPGTLKTLLPGLSAQVPCPADCGIDNACAPDTATVGIRVIHLNDDHRWTREQIADWLDTLDVDLRFPTGEAA